MRIEIKGLIAAVIAGTAVVGAAYGVSARLVGTHGGGDNHQTAKPASTPPNAAPMTGAALVAQGRQYYTQSCANCHGAAGTGGYGPSLHHEDMTDAHITAKIKNGVPGKMPAFAKKYDAGQTQTLVAYIRSLK